MDNGQDSTSDLDAMTDRIGEAVFGPSNEAATPEAPADAASPTPTPEVTPLEVPDTWPKEMHEHWGLTPRQVQEYWRTREQQMKEGLNQYKSAADFAKEFDSLLTPFQPTLRQLQLNPIQAVRSLLTADHNLRYSTPEQKRALAQTFLKNYGIDLASPATGYTGQPAHSGQAGAQPDPVVQQLEQKLQHLESTVEAQQRAVYEAARSKASQEVEVFASDAKAHPYFDEVADGIAGFVSQGKSLQDAYDMAVWANPVTRAKEQARLFEERDAKMKETARLDALPKKRAAGVNVKHNDAGRAPSEPLGSLEDTIRETHRQLKARVS